MFHKVKLNVKDKVKRSFSISINKLKRKILLQKWYLWAIFSNDTNFDKIGPVVKEIWGFEFWQDPHFPLNNHNFKGPYLENH